MGKRLSRIKYRLSVKNITAFMGDYMCNNISKKALLCILAVSILFIIGCSKLTTKNYDRLTMGMDYDKVVEILGDADKCDGAMGVKNCTWGNDTKYININFIGNKVVLFSGKGL